MNHANYDHHYHHSPSFAPLHLSALQSPLLTFLLLPFMRGMPFHFLIYLSAPGQGVEGKMKRTILHLSYHKNGHVITIKMETGRIGE